MSPFEQNIAQIWGKKGQDWLKKLPSIVDNLAQHWRLTNLKPVANLSYNYVMTGLQNNKPIILKIGYDQKELSNEYFALKAYKQACIKLIDGHCDSNALLLEQAVPGASLKSLYPEFDDSALKITADIMKKLHKEEIPLNSGLPTVQEWFKNLFEPQNVLNEYHINKARTLAQKLFANQTNPVLLHGDLHHDNIILNGTEYLAIDPKGIIGDPAYEVYAFIKNPDPLVPKSKDLMMHRIGLFSKYLDIPEIKLRQWAYVQAVLEACWAVKDGHINPEISLIEAQELDF